MAYVPSSIQPSKIVLRHEEYSNREVLCVKGMSISVDDVPFEQFRVLTNYSMKIVGKYRKLM